MAVGEYRSHLYFRADKSTKPLGSDQSGADTTQLKVQLIPVFGLSIPIIIRSGSVNVGATLTDLHVEFQDDSIPKLKLALNRTGNISIYGDFIVDYYPDQGKNYEIGRVNGVSVYANINRRQMAIKLIKMPGVAFNSGSIKVRYISNDPNRKSITYAESQLYLK